MLKFTPITVPHNIMVVGCGGTGSRLVPLLTQFLRSIMKDHNPRGWLGTPNIVLCDFDTIEPKNLLRQNFIASDVDKNKAVVLSDRYSRAFGINVIPMTEKITERTDIFRFFIDKIGIDISSQPFLLIMCVDSVEARRVILNNMFYIRSKSTNGNLSNITIIDSGNEDNFGQVNIFNPVVLTNKLRLSDYEKDYVVDKLITSVTDVPLIPMDLEHYINIVDHPNVGSCADLDQTLAINALIATNIMSLVQNYYYRKPFTYNAVHIDMAGGSYISHNTLSTFKGKAIHSSIPDYIRIKKSESEAISNSINSLLGGAHPGIYNSHEIYLAVYKAEEKLKAENKVRIAAEEKARKDAKKAKKLAEKKSNIIITAVEEKKDSEIVKSRKPTKKVKDIIKDVDDIAITVVDPTTSIVSTLNTTTLSQASLLVRPPASAVVRILEEEVPF